MRAKLRVSMCLPALLLGAGALLPVAASAQQSTPPTLAPATSQANAQALQNDHRQGQYFDLGNGSDIFYQITGHGPPLLLIHGYPLDGAMFEYQQQGLSNDFTVITLDLPGYGKSHTTTPDGSIQTYAHDVLALMNHLNIQKAVIGGHSMGGVITMEMYKEAPQRFAGMLLIDTNANAAPIVGHAEWLAYGQQAEQMGVDSTIPLLIPQMLTGVTRMDNPRATNELKSILREASQTAYEAGGQALASRADYNSLLPDVRVPTLIVVGQDDPLWAYPLDQKMHREIPGSSLAILPGAAHASVYEKPREANNAILQWASQQHWINGSGQNAMARNGNGSNTTNQGQMAESQMGRNQSNGAYSAQ